jgi:hypothetical protein
MFADFILHIITLSSCHHTSKAAGSTPMMSGCLESTRHLEHFGLVKWSPHDVEPNWKGNSVNLH